MASAISICEIINKPEAFVSRAPHFVVDKLDWIRCRYLFVDVIPTDTARGLAAPRQFMQTVSGYIEQDGRVRLCGHKDAQVDIPKISKQWNPTEDASNVAESTEAKAGLEPKSAPFGSDYSLGDDLDVALNIPQPDGAGKQRHPSPPKRQRSDTGYYSDTSTAPPNKMAVTEKLKFPIDDTIMRDFRPGALDIDTLPKLPEPKWAVSSPLALSTLQREIHSLQKLQSSAADIHALGWHMDFEQMDNLFHWIAELHSFDKSLPLSRDMMELGITSIVLEIRFGSNFPNSPPFVRVIRPAFLPFSRGGGGHVTEGGAICSQLLTNSGWLPSISLEKIFLEVRLNLCETERPARLEMNKIHRRDYDIHSAVAAYNRAASSHKWKVSEDLAQIAEQGPGVVRKRTRQ